MITSKTTDRLMSRAHEINAISDAVYEAGFKDESNELAKIAALLSGASDSIRAKLDAYARNAMDERQDEAPKPG